MKKLSINFFLLFACLTGTAQQPFSECAVAFLDGTMIVGEYSPRGKSVLSQTATGMLTVHTAQISESGCVPQAQIEFLVAVRNSQTGTLLMITKKPVKEIEIPAILGHCQPGDHVLLLTTEEEFALPHNEILVTE